MLISTSESYSLIFTDSLVSNLAINFHREFALYSAKMFGDYNAFLIVLTVTIAFLLASLLNYIFGRMLNNVFGVQNNSLAANNNFFYLLLIASIIPMVGKFIITLAGFKKLNPLKVLCLCGSLKLCYYFGVIYM